MANLSIDRKGKTHITSVVKDWTGKTHWPGQLQGKKINFGHIKSWPERKQKLLLNFQLASKIYFSRHAQMYIKIPSFITTVVLKLK